MASIIPLYQSIQVIFNITFKCFFGAVLELQIGAIFYIIGPLLPLLDCVVQLLRHGVIRKLAVFDDASSLKKCGSI